MRRLGVFSPRTQPGKALVLSVGFILSLSCVAVSAPSALAARGVRTLHPKPAIALATRAIDVSTRSLAVAKADFDGDGVEDLAVGFDGESGPGVAIYRGNIAAVYPNSPEAREAATSAPFLPEPAVYALSARPDLLAAADLDVDGRIDLVAAERGGTSLFALRTNAEGRFGQAEERALDGTVTSLAVGEFGMHDGITDLAVGVSNEAGSHALLFASRTGALDADAVSIALGEPASALAFGLDVASGTSGLAIATGSSLVTVPGTVALSDSLGARVSSVDAGAARDLGAQVVALSSTADGIVALDAAGTVHALGASGDRVAATGVAGATAFAAGTDGSFAVLDPQSRQLHVVGDLSASKRAADVVSLEGTPVATIAMRLNADAIADFVTITAESLTPSVTASKLLATFTVNTTADSGAGSLRQAILDANSTAGADTIDFNIGTAGKTIDLLSALPALTEAVTIDGTTQPGFAGVPLIELNGTGAGAGVDGLDVTGGATTIRGLVINRFTGVGIRIQTVGNNVVEGNYIGTSLAGTADQGNGDDGVRITAVASNTIGGTTAAARNVISGNNSDGVQIETAGATLNTVAGNYIGLAATGTAGVGNTGSGVVLSTAAVTNTIGGATAASQNVISANTQNGVLVQATDANTNVIQQNRIGTNAGDTGGLGNGANGVSINGTGTTVQTNRIAFNGGSGVAVAQGVANNLTTNSISDNGALGIDLLPVGVTPNDANDVDTGANTLQNFPALTSATSQGTTTTIVGTLASTPSTAFRIEFFANASCDASGNGEGATYLGFVNVTTGPTGAANVNAVLTATVSAGQTITSTATDPNGNTSEFSECRGVAVSADLSVTKNGSVESIPSGASLTYTIVIANAGPLAAADVQLLDATPSGTTFTSISSPQGTFTTPAPNGSGPIIGTIGTINAGASVTVTLVVRVTGPTGLVITNTVFVQSSTPDANLANNTATETTAVIAPPEIISIAKVATEPFRVKITGTNFQPGVQVFIGNDVNAWPDVKFKNGTSLTLRKGATLKTKFPKGIAVPIRVVNPDGGEDTATFTR